MNRQQMNAPFAEEELHNFKGRGGQTMTYIEDETVMDRLDLGYGPGNWQVQVDAISDSVVKVRLGVREAAEWVWFEDFGYPNREGGESLKEAVSDGIRRCGRYVGIARDLYRRAPDSRRDDMAPDRPAPPHLEPQMDTPDGGLIGTAITQGTQDGELRQSPTGWTLPFRVKNGTRSFIVVAEDELAEALAAIWPTVKGARVTVWGRWSDETIPAKPNATPPKPEVHYRILHLSRIQTADLTLPAPGVDEPPEDLALIGEAETAPLGLVG